MTLIETLIATALGALLSTGLAALMYFSNRSLAAIANYVDLNHRSRFALDQMSRDIRQARRLVSYTSTSLTFEGGSGETLVFSYDPNGKTLTRIRGGVADQDPLLTECDVFKFSIYQRNPISGTYDQFSTGSPSTCKLIQLNWVCSRTIRGTRVNTESVQSAKIVIRKQ